MATTIQHAANTDRVRGNTREDVNRRIDRETELRLSAAAAMRRPEIDHDILRLGREWDFERVLEAEAAITGLTGIVLALTVDKRWLGLPGLAASMVFLHGLQGWYPMLPVFRRLGVRSQEEIDRKYYALKALRGDFDQPAGGEARIRAASAWKAVIA
jgi:hypothetical protein